MTSTASPMRVGDVRAVKVFVSSPIDGVLERGRVQDHRQAQRRGLVRFDDRHMAAFLPGSTHPALFRLKQETGSES